MLAEQQQKVGKLGVGEGMTVGDQEVAQLATGRKQLAQAAHLVLPIGESPSGLAARRRHPIEQELTAALAQLAQDVRKKRLGPVERTGDPARQLAAGDIRRVAVQGGRKRAQRETFDDEPSDHGEDPAETGGLVGHVRAGEYAWEAAAKDRQLLNDDGMLAIASGTATPAISPKGPHASDEGGVNESDPARVILSG